jgi:predicted secreted hydrolase
MAHFGLTDTGSRRFVAGERLSRGALGLAGGEARPFRVWVEDWSAEAPSGVLEDGVLLRASTSEGSIELHLEPLKSAVSHGRAGLDAKGPEAGNASYYYSLSRMRAAGTIVDVGGTPHEVAGRAWMDREWGTSALSPGVEGWDWFALQLEDGSNLMFYQLRERDGSAHPMSAGTWMPARGVPQHLSRDEVMLEVRERWESPAGGSYPMAWTLAVPAEDLFLRVDPVLESQELHTGVRYWEGAVNVSGRRAGEPVSGRGYVELTGYAR